MGLDRQTARPALRRLAKSSQRDVGEGYRVRRWSPEVQLLASRALMVCPEQWRVGGNEWITVEAFPAEVEGLNFAWQRIGAG